MLELGTQRFPNCTGGTCSPVQHSVSPVEYLSSYSSYPSTGVSLSRMRRGGLFTNKVLPVAHHGEVLGAGKAMPGGFLSVYPWRTLLRSTWEGLWGIICALCCVYGVYIASAVSVCIASVCTVRCFCTVSECGEQKDQSDHQNHLSTKTTTTRSPPETLGTRTKHRWPTGTHSCHKRCRRRLSDSRCRIWCPSRTVSISLAALSH